MPMQPGTTLLNGQYRILRLIAQGGFGSVYHARDTLLDRDVAIKELVPALVSDPAWVKRFLVEARATLDLHHPHVVATHTLFAEAGNHYLVMEYMSGGSLEDRLRREAQLSQDDALRIARQVCDGLSYAHCRGVVHCDLKPANILFAADGTAKVGDFGIAHVSAGMLSRTWATSSGFVAGTMAYMSPEQADGERCDPRIDLYALGAVLYRMLTGRPYLDFDQGATPGAAADNINAIRQKQPFPPSAYDARIPPWLDALVLRLLAKRPDERPETAAALLAELQPGDSASLAGAKTAGPADQGQAPPTSEGTGRTVQARRLPRRLWPLVAGAALALLAIGAGLAALIAAQRAEPTPMPTASWSTTPTPKPLPTASSTPTHTPSPTATRAPTVAPSYTPVPGAVGADRVVAFNPGPGAQPNYGDPQALLGLPDLVEQPCCQGVLQLGRGGSVLLAFADRAIVDGPGPDFRVAGESTADDYLLVEVSADGETWKAYPRVAESSGPLDLADVELAKAVYVRLTDWQPATSTGAEVDAVVALNNGPGPGDALPSLPDAVATKNLTLYDGPDVRMKLVGRVAAAEKLLVLGRCLLPGWVKVQKGAGASGWCRTDDLVMNVTLSTRPLLTPPSTPTPTNTPRPTPVVVIGVSLDTYIIWCVPEDPDCPPSRSTLSFNGLGSYAPEGSIVEAHWEGAANCRDQSGNTYPLEIDGSGLSFSITSIGFPVYYECTVGVSLEVIDNLGNRATGSYAGSVAARYH